MKAGQRSSSLWLDTLVHYRWSARVQLGALVPWVLTQIAIEKWHVWRRGGGGGGGGGGGEFCLTTPWSRLWTFGVMKDITFLDHLTSYQIRHGPNNIDVSEKRCLMTTHCSIIDIWCHETSLLPHSSTNEMNISLVIVDGNFTIPTRACVGMYGWKHTHLSPTRETCVES